MTKPRKKDHSPIDYSAARYPGDYARDVDTVRELELEPRYARCPGGVRCRLFEEVVSGEEVGPEIAPLPKICVGTGKGGFREQALSRALRSYFARVVDAIEAFDV